MAFSVATRAGHDACSMPLAAGGGLVWAITSALLEPGWAAAVFLLAPLVVVPLGLSLIAGRRRHVYPRLTSAATALQLPAALLLLAGFVVEPGLVAAVLALPWLVVCLLVAAMGAMHLARRGNRSPGDAAIDLGAVYLVVGGASAVMSRYGARPLDFSDIIVLATAIHFHYAGFALPLVTGLAAARLGDRVSRLAAAGVVVGVPLVGAGITLSAFGPRWLDLAAAWLLTAACLLAATLPWRVAQRVDQPWAAALLMLSGFSLLAAMPLAGVYALGMFLGADWLDIPFMLRYHGTLNALGFALPGLAGWNLLELSPESTTETL